MQLEPTRLPSRRYFLALYVSVGVGISGQMDAKKNAQLRVDLVKVFKNSFLLTTSPDACLICLGCSTKPIGRFTIFDFRGDGRTVEHEASPRFTLKVIETGTWSDVYSGILKRSPW